MSIARALTGRRDKTISISTSSAYLGRAASQRAPNAKPINRAQISLPVELLSSTNVLTYDAPNIVNAPNARQGASRLFSPSTKSTASSLTSLNGSSDNDSDQTTSDHSHDTDATSVDLSSPESNHGRFSRFAKDEIPSKLSAPTLSPTIPVRASTHTRRAHVLSSQSRPIGSRQSHWAASSQQTSSSVRINSVDMFNGLAVNSLGLPVSAPKSASPLAPAAPVSYPFGKELEQLAEAENSFREAVRDADADADAAAMRSRGLMRFCAADYLEEIAGLSPFAGWEPNYQHSAWI